MCAGGALKGNRPGAAQIDADAVFTDTRRYYPCMPSILLYTLILPLISVVACPMVHAQQDDAESFARQAERSIVEATAVSSQLREAWPNGVVLDVRDEEAYNSGHIPGAVRVDYDQWDELSRSGATGLEHAEQWHERIGSLGIDSDAVVFIYDDGRMTRAARIWYVLQHFGVARAAVVNGGFPLVEEASDRGQLSLTVESSRIEPKQFKPAETDGGRVGLISRNELKEAIDRGEVQILDARTTDEYEGIDLRKNSRGGHLPTARNIPHARLLDERGRLRSADELVVLLDAAGFVKGRIIITHCDGGGRAALAALAAARAGYGPVLNYYLSFSDWAADASCPVVGGGG